MERFTHDGLTFDVIDAGPRDGDPVVLLHGFPQDASAWDAVAPRLHAAGLRTLAPHQRGYCPGAAPAAVPAYRLPALVDDVLALADAAGAARVHVVGHDWGGAVAWATAARAPERVASLTVLSTPHPGAFAAALRTPDQLRRSWYMAAFQVPGLPEHLLAPRLASMLAGQGVPRADAVRYARRLGHPGRLRTAIHWYRANRSLGSDVTGPVDVPTTYVWGSRDMALGRGAAEGTAAHVTGDYRFVELDADHWLPENEAERVAAEIVARTY